MLAEAQPSQPPPPAPAPRHSSHRLAWGAAAATGLLLGVAATLLFCRDSAAARTLAVDLQASSREAPAGGGDAIRLHARVTDAATGQAVPPPGLRFEWTADLGTLRPAGAAATWLPAAAPGEARIAVVVHHPDYAPGRAAISLRATPPDLRPAAAEDPEQPEIEERFRRAEAFQGPPPEPPVIDAILVEKEEVCEGEENLITVKAHTVDGKDDAYLHYLIGSDAGASVPLRSYLPDPGESRAERTVTVFGRHNVATTVPLPPFKVKDCKARRVALLEYRNLPNTEATFELWVRIKDVAASTPFAAVSYAWDFGDGRTATSTVPRVEHGYEDRPQDTLYSHFLVAVEATGKDGEKVRGRRPLALLNPVFEQVKYKGLIYLPVDLIPRFPELDSWDRVHQRVRIRNVHGERVWLTEVVEERSLRGGLPSAPAASRSPKSLLGGDEIPAGGVLEAELELDTRRDPEVALLAYEVAGRSESGLKAFTRFSVMAPPPRPEKGAATPVVDPLLKAKILRAREVLGKAFVTDEEIWQLEREGRLGPLVVPTPAVPLPTLPPPPRESAW